MRKRQRRYALGALAGLLVLGGGATWMAQQPAATAGLRVRAATLSAPPASLTLRLILSDGSGHTVYTLAWRRRLPIPPQPTTVIIVNGSRQVATTAPGAGLATLEADQRRRRIFVTELDSATIHAVDAPSGRPLWTAVVDPAIRRMDNRPVLRSPLVDEQTGRLFVADFRTGVISVLLSASGRRIGTVKVPLGGIDMAAIAPTRRVFVFHGGSVSVLDGVSGRLVGSSNYGSVYGFGPAIVDQRSGRVFLANGVAGTVTMLDGLTGRVVRTIRVGQYPTLPVVDEHAGSAGQVRVWSTGPNGRNGTIGIGSTAVLDGRSGRLVQTLRGDVGAMNLGWSSQGGYTLPRDPWAWIPWPVRQHLPFVPPPPAPIPPPYRINLTVSG